MSNSIFLTYLLRPYEKTKITMESSNPDLIGSLERHQGSWAIFWNWWYAHVIKMAGMNISEIIAYDTSEVANTAYRHVFPMKLFERLI